MSLRTLEHDAPSIFRSRLPAAVRLLVLCAICAVLMVVDARWRVTQPLRQVIATGLYPMQWALLQPLRWLADSAHYLESLEQAQSAAQEARRQMASVSLQARRFEMVSEENARLRSLLGLRQRITSAALAAEVVYESPDSYTRRIILDRGHIAGVQLGSPVIDELGVLGQVTRVQPFTSEVRLLTDREQALSVQVARSGVRAVVYGSASNLAPDKLDLRFIPGDADVEEGDLIVTSGLDGTFPEGLPVGSIESIERQGAVTFLRISSTPLGRMQGARHVIVLAPLNLALVEALPDLPELINLPAVEQQKARDDKSAQRRSIPQRPLEESDP